VSELVFVVYFRQGGSFYRISRRRRGLQYFKAAGQAGRLSTRTVLRVTYLSRPLRDVVRGSMRICKHSIRLNPQSH